MMICLWLASNIRKDLAQAAFDLIDRSAGTRLFGYAILGLADSV